MKVKRQLGIIALRRKVAELGGTYALREQSEAYAGKFAGASDALMPDSTIPCEKKPESTDT